ncbi:MAG: QueT transporter family protein [Lachnospiraceae bacterium]|nr:QueT transporter family protein [Lachnospiraceae bacterium]MCI9546649.1 QueT transporter family protein [Lachnospiraceae bacterium]
MNLEHLSRTQKLTISGLMMALYIVVLYTTQSFSFGPYQIRIATSLYAVSYLCPFLIIPMGLANLTANFLFGGLGILDIVGGGIVGIVTTSLIVLIKRMHWNTALIALPIIAIPGLGVAIWLSYLLQIPYPPLALSLCIGQTVPGLCGVLLVKALHRIFYERSVQA